MKPTKAALAAMLTCAALSAADTKGLDMAMVFRAGSGFGDLKADTNRAPLMGVGLAIDWGLGDGGTIVGQIGYTYFASGDQDLMKRSGDVYYNGSNTLAGAPLWLSPESSSDSRRNKLEGFGARIGYSRKFLGDWSWQAGLSLNRYQSRQEASGTLRPVSGAATSTINGQTFTVGTLANATYYEGIYQTPTTNKVNLGAFVGARRSIGENFFFEANLLSVGYTKVNWVPYTYTGQAAHSETTNRRGMAVEFGFGLKL
jgi:hypothetical protein